MPSAALDAAFSQVSPKPGSLLILHAVIPTSSPAALVFPSNFVTAELAFQEEPQNFKMVLTVAMLSVPPGILYTVSAPPGNDLYGHIWLLFSCFPIGFGSWEAQVGNSGAGGE